MDSTRVSLDTVVQNLKHCNVLAFRAAAQILSSLSDHSFTTMNEYSPNIVELIGLIRTSDSFLS